MDIEIAKREALANEFIGSSISAAFKTRKGMKIYNNGSTDNEKINLKNYLKEKLKLLPKKYLRGNISDAVHFTTISDLSNEISKSQHAAILCGGRFRLGISQKAINVYLKLLWCAGWTPTPPHCPFDNIIIQRLLREGYLHNNMNWTSIDNLQDYRILVDAACNAANDGGHDSLASWELKAYLER